MRKRVRSALGKKCALLLLPVIPLCASLPRAGPPARPPALRPACEEWECGGGNPSAGQQDFLGVLWLGAAEPVIDISKSQNVGWEPLSLERREIGSWSWSMAGILKGFLFNALFAFKKENRRHLGTGESPACGAPGAGSLRPAPDQRLDSGHFQHGPCVCLAKPGIGKTKGFPARFH